MTVRLRMAPSPTGNFHIGTLRTALFNWLWAKHLNGTFVLRIEDTDFARSKPEFEQNILEYMTWMGLTPDEGPIEGGPYTPYRQSERIAQNIYSTYAQKLLQTGHAYYCFCTEAELEAERNLAQEKNIPYVYSRKCTHLTPEDIQTRFNTEQKPTIRFKMPETGVTEFDDLIRGPIKFDNHLISDFVLVRSDQLPSYNFAVVVDDFEMQITHVIRGEDHISNTPKQLAIFKALNLPAPSYGHLPIILAPDRSKLSKRHGATSVADYHLQGYLPDALFNYLTLLGWSSPTGEEILNRQDIISQFTLDRISKSGAIFDVVKLKWMNGQYIRKQSPETLLHLCQPFFSQEIKNKAAQQNPKLVERMVFSIKDNLDLLTDVSTHLAVYFLTESQYQTALSEFTFSDQDKTIIANWKDFLSSQKNPSPTDIQTGLDTLLTTLHLPKGKLFKPIRLACSGMGTGPHLPDLLSILPLNTLISRCEYCLK